MLAWLLVSPGAGPAHACTLFAAAGSRVEGGGTIIVKNRDRTPRQSALKVLAPPDGYQHLALVAMDAPQDSPVAGVNSKGLAVVDALPNLPPQEEKAGAVNLTGTLLSQCASVDEVLARRDLFRASYPVFEMVADARKIALIAIDPQGRVAVQVRDQGVLCQTNHYLDPRLRENNLKPGASSGIRYHRILQLLIRQTCPYSLEDFLAFSQDRHDGPDNSICRRGSTPAETRTLATWIVAHPAGGVPRVWVKITNPGAPQKIVSLKLAPSWWAKGLPDKVL
ncbi:MAG: carcinine hydrolase/isopenicillin-N N-acyltransferase family protein [Syntrophales bacterium]|nr:carcinine hydrolase/isopenicillin-N N-acyltransferase family protein [Syntrophales bacterium]MDD5640449.1 carcinine hydrolase/isopenicillin-N N-acyltransferase family protein [Syntrophales bacterium]